jgi:Spy/CpxP family protein refolding chaperone
MKYFALGLTTMFLAAAPLAAPLGAQDHGQHQQHQQHHQDGEHGEHAQHGMHMMQGMQGMMQGGGHCMGMMGSTHPGMILKHADHLDLSAGQVQRLEALRDRAHEGGMGHMKAAMESHNRASALLDTDRPDFDVYEAQVEEAAGHMVQAHAAMARVAAEARGILTAEQRSQLQGMAGEMSHGMHGMKQGGDMKHDSSHQNH